MKLLHLTTQKATTHFKAGSVAWHSRHVVQLSATSQDRIDIQKGLLFSASSHVYAGAEAARLPGT